MASINNNRQLQPALHMLNSSIFLVKMVCGVGNNAAWMACLDAFDRIKTHPRFLTRVKGGTTPRSLFLRCFEFLRKYERRLINNPQKPFFHVVELDEPSRRVFGDISDHDYYDLWCAPGFQTYQDTLPFFTSLVNKFRLGYLSIGASCPETLAWANAAQVALELAVRIYNNAIATCHHRYPRVSTASFSRVFRDFCLSPVNRLWYQAMLALDPACATPFSDTHRRNITQGIEQLEQLWLSSDSLFGSRITSAADYAELFRTNGTLRKATAQFAEMRQSFETQMQNLPQAHQT